MIHHAHKKGTKADQTWGFFFTKSWTNNNNNNSESLLSLKNMRHLHVIYTNILHRGQLIVLMQTNQMKKFAYKQKYFQTRTYQLMEITIYLKGYSEECEKKVAVGTFLLVEAWAEDPGLWADPFWETTGVAQAFSCLDLWRNQRVMLEEPREQIAL